MVNVQRPLEPKMESTATTTAKMTSVSREEFINHRDQVLTGLTSIMKNINDFYQGFVFTTNTMLHGSDADQATTYNITAMSNILGGGPILAAGKRAKKVKPIRDPNAPKKPLTAFFLFQQSARPIVAQDLGEEATPREVSDETQRRWAAMSEDEKQQWKDRYQVSRKQYVLDYAAYTAGTPMVDGHAVVHDEDEDDEVEPTAEEIHHASAGFAEVDSDDESEEESDDEPPPPPPVVTKPVKPAKSKKANGAGAAAARSPSPSGQLVPGSQVPVPGAAAEKKPAAKRKRKDDTAAVPTSSAPAPADPTPKKARKNAKAPTADEAPANEGKKKAAKDENAPKRKRKSDAA